MTALLYKGAVTKTNQLILFASVNYVNGFLVPEQRSSLFIVCCF